MDWQHVTVEELLSALREEDWTQRPRTLLDVVGQFSTPRNQRKWESRLKCNVYYYHTNYVILLAVALLLPQYSRPLALLGSIIVVISMLLLNNTFANSADAALVKLVKQVSPRTASKLKSGHSVSLGPPGRDGRAKVTVLGVPRGLAVLLVALAGLVMVQRGGGVLRWLLGTAAGWGAVVAHASLRNPNLKARLSNARDEFRAVWRNAQFHDYTL